MPARPPVYLTVAAPVLSVVANKVISGLAPLTPTVTGNCAIGAPVSSVACTVKLACVPADCEALALDVRVRLVSGSRPSVVEPCVRVTAKVRPPW